MNRTSSNQQRDILTDAGGDYYRLLTDGSYAIHVKKPGYETETQYITVHNQDHQSSAQRVDFVLQSTSSDRINLQQMLRKFLDKVRASTTSSFSS